MENTITILKSFLFCFFVMLIPTGLMAEITYEVTNASCKGKKDGAIDLNVSGEEGPYKFEWSNGAKSEDIFDLAEGEYTVKVFSKNECVFEKTITVEVEEDKPRLSINGGGPHIICESMDANIILHATTFDCVGCQYSWSNGSTSSKISATNTGTYSVKVVDENNCFVEESTSVTIRRKDCHDDDDHIEVVIIKSTDPNDIIGPEGVGDPKWVSVNDVLPYKIRFENDPDFASAPAMKVIIRSPIDKNINIFSFRLNSFGFGNFVFDVPKNSAFYVGRLDVTDSLGVVVDVVAGIDVNKNEAFWIFESKDPKTGLPPENAELGFLLVNDSVFHRGEGFVSYSVKPDKNAKTGDTINAIADIVFDNNESILTPEIFNTVDAFPPKSYIIGMDEKVDSIINIPVFAEDDYGAGGCGVAEYDLFISEDNGISFNLLEGNIPIDSVYEFTGIHEAHYCMYSIARDSVSNAELKKSSDICFSIRSNALVLSTPETPVAYCMGTIVPIRWRNNIGIDSVLISYSADGGGIYQTIAGGIPGDDSIYYWQLSHDMIESSEYIIKIQDISDDEVYDVTNTVFTIHKTIPAQIASTYGKDICQNDTTVLDVGDGFKNILWSTGDTIQTIETHIEGDYYVEVIDINGCASIDTLNLRVHPIPKIPVIRAPIRTLFCPYDSVELSIPWGYAAYLWSNMDTTKAIFVSETGSYTGTLITEYGCSSTSAAVSIDAVADDISPILVVQNFTLELDAQGNAILKGEDVIIEATDNCNISDTTISKTSFNHLDIGVHNVEVSITDVRGNISTKTIEVTVVDKAAPIITCHENIVVKSNNPNGYIVQSTEFELVSIEENGSLKSLNNDFNNLKSLTGALFPIGETSVIWTATDNAGNTETCSFNVTVSNATGYFIIGEGYDVKMFPNPTSGKIQLEFEGFSAEQIEVIDMNGKTVYTKKAQIQQKEIVDLSNLLNGVYVVYISTDKEAIITKTIIKE